MALSLSGFSEIGLDGPSLERRVEAHEREVLPRLHRLWNYYRNPETRADASGAARLAQAEGLPLRLRSGARREVVIENDIAWRLHAMVDFMFGQSPAALSTAPDESKRERIQRAVDATLEASGGIGLLQDMALLGAVHGHVGLLLRAEGLEGPAPRSIEEAARRLRIEVIEAGRVIPILDPGDYRRLLGVIIRTVRPGATPGERSRVLEVLSARRRAVFVDDSLALEEANPLGELGYVHLQNTSQPFRFAGLSEVEPLIALQDELNTRLSDRAHRVTLQSFKMYLAKGLDGVAESPTEIGPGRVWSTDNPDASIEAFGGDADSPSEESHIEQIRQAMDKVSSVTPIAAGVIRARVGQLSSENALRITMMGLLAKTARKQTTYGRGLAELSRLILKALDGAGALRTGEEERGIAMQWPDPLPRREIDELESAEAKQRLGVARDRVLAELGYAPTDLGVQ